MIMHTLQSIFLGSREAARQDLPRLGGGADGVGWRDGRGGAVIGADEHDRDQREQYAHDKDAAQHGADAADSNCQDADDKDDEQAYGHAKAPSVHQLQPPLNAFDAGCKVVEPLRQAGVVPRFGRDHVGDLVLKRCDTGSKLALPGFDRVEAPMHPRELLSQVVEDFGIFRLSHWRGFLASKGQGSRAVRAALGSVTHSIHNVKEQAI